MEGGTIAAIAGYGYQNFRILKKIAHNIYYFFYLTFNWNIFLAFFVVWHEVKRGTKYQINTVKPESLKRLTIHRGDISKSSPYEAVSYFLLEKLLEEFRKLSSAASIIDLGCGKGRVMVVSAFFGFTSITGIDFAKELCKVAEKNIQTLEKKFDRLHWKVICTDVVNYEIQPGDNVFFMSNPFNDEILNQVLSKIEVSLKEEPRIVWFIYAIPVHLRTLLDHNYEVVKHIYPGKRLNAVILKKG